jgi:hypothetical protein
MTTRNKTKRTRRNFFLAALPFLFGLLIPSSNAKQAKPPDPLQSFYIVTHYFSDFLSDSYEEILDVTPLAKDVRVRVIRISSATRYCGGTLVRAAERVLPNTTLRKVARGIAVCNYSAKDVDAALASAKPILETGTEDSATLSFVAKCGTQENVVEFPYPETVDLKILHRDSPRVNSLWDLVFKIRVHAFGPHSPFRDLSPTEEKHLEDQGTQLLPELLSGKYNAGFAGYECPIPECNTNYLAGLLRDYTGPPANRDPASVELVNATSLHLAKYVSPPFPRIAETAHVLGEVHLRIVPDPQTGVVKDVELLSGPRLLGDPAVKAARNWQFTPGSQSGQPVEAILKFTLCPNESN